MEPRIDGESPMDYRAREKLGLSYDEFNRQKADSNDKSQRQKTKDAEKDAKIKQSLTYQANQPPAPVLDQSDRRPGEDIGNFRARTAQGIPYEVWEQQKAAHAAKVAADNEAAKAAAAGEKKTSDNLEFKETPTGEDGKPDQNLDHNSPTTDNKQADKVVSGGDKKDKSDVKQTSKTLKDINDREFTASDINSIDTILNIGSLMTDRVISGIAGSLEGSSKIRGKLLNFNKNVNSDDSNSFTPIEFASIKLAKELGILPSDGSNELIDLFYDADSTGVVNKYGAEIVVNRDNSIGDAWVVNPPFQFNPNDDVRSNRSFPEFGRVFNEKIASRYPIVTFEVGTIKYNTGIIANTALDYDDTNSSLSKRIRGENIDLTDQIIGAPGALLGLIYKSCLGIVTAPLSWITGSKQYAVFKNDMTLFQSYYEDMIQIVAVHLGLLKLPYSEFNDSALGNKLINDSDEDDPVGPDGKRVSMTQEEAQSLFTGIENDYKKTETDELSKDDTAKEKVDILDAFRVDKRPTAKRIAGEVGGSYMGIRKGLVMNSILPGRAGTSEQNYIPFMVGRDVSISESISNSTQANPLAQQLNSKAAEAAADKANNNVSAGGNAASSAGDAIKKKGENFINSMFRGDLKTVYSGEGRVTLPDMWSDSSFSRSISLNFTFTSPYGHKLSIFENTYLPFLLLMCMTMPRQISKRTYSNPFFIRAYMPGFFSVPMGIIESLSIERGDDKNNWTTDGIPRTIKCSIAIKDLSPVMMFSMARSKFFGMFQSNETYSTYLNTLGGLSLIEMANAKKNIKKIVEKLNQRFATRKSGNGIVDVLDILNPFSYVEAAYRKTRGSVIGDTRVAFSKMFVGPEAGAPRF